MNRQPSLVDDTVWQLQQYGYKKEDILRIGVDYIWMKSQTYETVAIFNEPNVTYYYYWNKEDSSIKKGGNSINPDYNVCPLSTVMI